VEGWAAGGSGAVAIADAAGFAPADVVAEELGGVLVIREELARCLGERLGWGGGEVVGGDGDAVDVEGGDDVVESLVDFLLLLDRGGADVDAGEGEVRDKVGGGGGCGADDARVDGEAVRF